MDEKIELVTKKKKCGCGGQIKPYLKRSAKLIIYTSSGTKQGTHKEYRCHNKHCRIGYYHGFFIEKGEGKLKYNYDEDCLDAEYLVTTILTAFEVKYLWDITLDLLGRGSKYKCSFLWCHLKKDRAG